MEGTNTLVLSAVFPRLAWKYE